MQGYPPPAYGYGYGYPPPQQPPPFFNYYAMPPPDAVTLEDWTRYKDDQGRYYYHNGKSGETVWQPPDVFKRWIEQQKREEAERKEQATGRVRIWSAHTNKAGREFFYNRLEKKSVWVKPDNFDETVEKSRLVALPPAPAANATAAASKPASPSSQASLSASPAATIAAAPPKGNVASPPTSGDSQTPANKTGATPMDTSDDGAAKSPATPTSPPNPKANGSAAAPTPAGPSAAASGSSPSPAAATGAAVAPLAARISPPPAIVTKLKSCETPNGTNSPAPAGSPPAATGADTAAPMDTSADAATASGAVAPSREPAAKLEGATAPATEDVAKGTKSETNSIAAPVGAAAAVKESAAPKKPPTPPPKVTKAEAVRAFHAMFNEKAAEHPEVTASAGWSEILPFVVSDKRYAYISKLQERKLLFQTWKKKRQREEEIQRKENQKHAAENFKAMLLENESKLEPNMRASEMEKVFGDEARFKALDDERARSRIFYDVLKKFSDREKKRKKEERLKNMDEFDDLIRLPATGVAHDTEFGSLCERFADRECVKVLTKADLQLVFDEYAGELKKAHKKAEEEKHAREREVFGERRRAFEGMLEEFLAQNRFHAKSSYAEVLPAMEGDERFTRVQGNSTSYQTSPELIFEEFCERLEEKIANVKSVIKQLLKDKDISIEVDDTIDGIYETLAQLRHTEFMLCDRENARIVIHEMIGKAQYKAELRRQRREKQRTHFLRLLHKMQVNQAKDWKATKASLQSHTAFKRLDEQGRILVFRNYMRELQKHGQAQPFVGDKFSRNFLGEKEEETSKKEEEERGVEQDDGAVPMETDAVQDDGLPHVAEMSSSEITSELSNRFFVAPHEIDNGRDEAHEARVLVAKLERCRRARHEILKASLSADQLREELSAASVAVADGEANDVDVLVHRLAGVRGQKSAADDGRSSPATADAMADDGDDHRRSSSTHSRRRRKRSSRRDSDGDRDDRYGDEEEDDRPSKRSRRSSRHRSSRSSHRRRERDDEDDADERRRYDDEEYRDHRSSSRHHRSSSRRHRSSSRRHRSSSRRHRSSSRRDHDDDDDRSDRHRSSSHRRSVRDGDDDDEDRHRARDDKDDERDDRDRRHSSARRRSSHRRSRSSRHRDDEDDDDVDDDRRRERKRSRHDDHDDRSPSKSPARSSERDDADDR